MGSGVVRSMGKVVMMIAVILVSTVEMSSSTSPSPSLTEECGEAIQKVTSCLTYATGKAVEPTKMCCDAVSGIKEKQPVCLCFFIGQAHNGTQQIKSLGIQEPKLLQLPSACHLANASISNCPKLLGISPTSPAAAVFLNNNATSPPSSSSSSSSTPAEAADNKSSGFKQEHGAFVALFLSPLIFLFGLPVGIYVL